MALDLGVTFPRGKDENVKVTSNDLAGGYLLSKLKAGANITLNEINDGGFEQVEIVSAGGGGGSGIYGGSGSLSANPTTITMGTNVLTFNASNGDLLKLDSANDRVIMGNSSVDGELECVTSSAIYKLLLTEVGAQGSFQFERTGDGSYARLNIGASATTWTTDGIRWDFDKDMALTDSGTVFIRATNATSFQLGQGSGTPTTIMMDSTGIAFFNTTPIAQQTTTSQTPATFTANTSGTLNDSATWNGYTIGDIVAILQAYGLIA